MTHFDYRTLPTEAGERAHKLGGWCMVLEEELRQAKQREDGLAAEVARLTRELLAAQREAAA